MGLREKLRRLRQELGLTQEEIARHIKVPLRSYVGWENGYNCPSVQNLRKLATFFEKPMGWFLD